LSALQLPTLAQAAASAAESAALLIVAVNGDKTLPRSVKGCLHRCARAIHAADAALVAQLHGILKINEELCPAHGCLRQIAQHAGGIMPGQLRSSEPPMTPSSRLNIPEHWPDRFPVLILSRSPAGTMTGRGINR